MEKQIIKKSEILRTIVKDGNCNQFHCFGENVFTNLGVICPLYAECDKDRTDQAEKAKNKLDSFFGAVE